MKDHLPKSKNRLVSVVMPAYKKEKTIYKDILKVKQVLDQIRYPYEIVCCVDGTNVDKTYENAEKLAKSFPSHVKVVGYPSNHGKGHAVRFGMAKTKGEIVAFIDAGSEIDPNGLSMILEHFEWYDADIVVGSKRHPASEVTYPWQRKILSVGYQLLCRVLFGLNVRDTQAGIKFYRREVLKKTLPRLLVKAYAFDVELLAVANYLGFRRIYEAPIKLKYNFDDLVHAATWKNIYYMLWDTAAVFYRLRILHYYDWKNRVNWITPKYLTLK